MFPETTNLSGPMIMMMMTIRRAALTECRGAVDIITDVSATRRHCEPVIVTTLWTGCVTRTRARWRVEWVPRRRRHGWRAGTGWRRGRGRGGSWSAGRHAVIQRTAATCASTARCWRHGRDHRLQAALTTCNKRNEKGKARLYYSAF